jgi:hypothetical protein
MHASFPPTAQERTGTEPVDGPQQGGQHNPEGLADTDAQHDGGQGDAHGDGYRQGQQEEGGEDGLHWG